MRTKTSSKDQSAARTMTELKTRANTLDVREFIDGISKDTRRQDCLTLLQLFEQITQNKALM